MSAAGEDRHTGRLQFWVMLHASSIRSLSRGDLAVLAAIVETHNWRAGYACPSFFTLARHAGISQQSVANSIKRLEAAGILTVTRGKNRTGNRYACDFTAAENTQARLSVRRNGTAKNTQADLSVSEQNTQVQYAGTLKSSTSEHSSPLETNPLQPEVNPRVAGGAAQRDAPPPEAAAHPVAPPSTDAEVAAAWSRLIERRGGKLDTQAIAEQARVLYLDAGRTPAELVAAIDRLRVVGHWKNLPVPTGAKTRLPKTTDAPAKRTPAAEAAPAKRTPAAEAAPAKRTPAAEAAPAPVPAKPAGKLTEREQLKRLAQRFLRVGMDVLKAERDRMHARVRAEFPEFAEELIGPGTTVSFPSEVCQRIKATLDDEWQKVTQRKKAGKT